MSCPDAGPAKDWAVGVDLMMRNPEIDQRSPEWGFENTSEPAIVPPRYVYRLQTLRFPDRGTAWGLAPP